MPTNTPAAGLSQPQIRALNALVTGSSVTEAAEAAGVHRCTVHTWCRGHHVFRSALEHSKRIAAESVLDQYRGLVDSAVAALRDIIESPDTAPSIRLKAALAVLNTVAGVQKQETLPKQDMQEVFFLDEVAQLPVESAAPETTPLPHVEAEDTDIARSPASACICGSGKKSWRCCGTGVMDLPVQRAA